jgi:hypothetical protein
MFTGWLAGGPTGAGDNHLLEQSSAVRHGNAEPAEAEGGSVT